MNRGASSLVAAFLVATGCSSPSQPSSTPAATPAVASAPLPVRSVAVSGLAGRGPSVTPCETLRFTAQASFKDDHTEDCTDTAAWASSDDRVLRPASRPGEMTAVAPGDALVSASCGGQTGSLPVKVAGGIRIVGLEDYTPFMLISEKPHVSALVVDAGGGQRDCGRNAVWSTSDYDVAHLADFDPGVIYSWSEGEAILTAACEGQTGQVLVRVGSYTVEGIVQDAGTGAPLPGAVLQYGLGRKATSDGQGRYAAPGQAMSPHTWFAWKNGYEVRVQRDIAWNRQPVVRLDWALERIPGILLEGTNRLCWNGSSGCEAGVPKENIYTFSVPAAGTLRVDTFWELDYNDRLYHELRCNGTLVEKGGRGDHNWGKLFEVAASPACAYELRFTQSTRNPTMTYDYTISWR